MITFLLYFLVFFSFGFFLGTGEKMTRGKRGHGLTWLMLIGVTLFKSFLDRFWEMSLPVYDEEPGCHNYI